MPFKLSLVVLVYPPHSADTPGLDVDLLQKANAWLQRRNAGFEDDLLLVGIGFDDESAMQAMVKLYGLGKAQLEAIPSDQMDVTNGIDFEETVGSIVEGWVTKHHNSAIPIVDWAGFIDDSIYPTQGWWWVGLNAANDEQSAMADILNELVPDSYRNQALTWATIIGEALDLNSCGEEHEAFHASMTALTLARWLTGFDAATENNFYSFCASDAIHTFDIDPLRLGFEAGRNHATELADYFDGEDDPEDELDAVTLKVCMENRNGQVRNVLSSVFGGNPALFWSLYASIWPEFKKPMTEAMDDLLNLRMAAEEGDLDRPWRFVSDGWIEFSEE